MCLRGRPGRTRAGVAIGTAWLALLYATPAGSAAGAATAPRYAARSVLAPGVEYREFTVPTARGAAYGHLLSVDLRAPEVGVDLLYPGAVGARAAVSRLADERGAVAAVNGDFFHVAETQHPGVEATGAPVGPAVVDGRSLKAAVPNGQRFGPALPPGTTTEDVIGVATDRTARLDRLSLRGAVHTPHGVLPLHGLNQYAIAVDGIGAFTAQWGSTSRMRATCGTDTQRGAPCSAHTHEVTVRHGRVTEVRQTPGSGPIAQDAVVLVGREARAQALRDLDIGDQVRVTHTLVGAGRVPLRFALGGFPIVRDDHPLAGLDTTTSAVRTSAGIGDGGHRLYLLALDGGGNYRSGLTIGELADIMLWVGATEAVNLDGGGSSTFAVREPGAAAVTVRNHPSGGAERAVPHAIGVFTRR